MVGEYEVSGALWVLSQNLFSFQKDYMLWSSWLKSGIVCQVAVSTIFFSWFIFLRLRGTDQHRKSAVLVRCGISSSPGYWSRCHCVLWSPSLRSVASMSFRWAFLTQRYRAMASVPRKNWTGDRCPLSVTRPFYVITGGQRQSATSQW